MSLTLQEFNDNFTVTTVRYDNSDMSNVIIHFKVQCNTNKRLSVHTTSVDTTQLSQGFTHSDVINSAWSNIYNTVNQWAAYNLVDDPLNMLTITSTTNDISLTDFNNNFTVYVCRFEPVPMSRPVDWCIGFRVQAKSVENITQNFEGVVPISSYCNNTLCADIANAAWDIVKGNVCSWAVNKLSLNEVLNNTFVPSII
jgi:hypothetical protein